MVTKEAKEELLLFIRTGQTLLLEKTLQESGPEPIIEGMSLLHYAIEQGQEEIVSLLLNKFDANVNQQASADSINAGYSALHFACANHDVDEDIVKILLTHPKADLQLVEDMGRTPFHYACMADSVPLAQLLLKHSAVNDAADKQGRTPLMLAASKGSEDVVAFCLNELDCDINVRDTVSGDTSLHHAFQTQSQELFNYSYPITAGHFESAYQIVAHGAHLNIENHSGDCAIDICNEHLADILECVAKYQVAFKEHVSSLKDILKPSFNPSFISQNDLLQLKLASMQFQTIYEGCGLLGGCPMIDTSKAAPIRKTKKERENLALIKPTVQDLEKQLKQMGVDSVVAEKAATVLAKNNVKTLLSTEAELKEEGGLQCPMGFKGDPNDPQVKKHLAGMGLDKTGKKLPSMVSGIGNNKAFCPWMQTMGIISFFKQPMVYNSFIMATGAVIFAVIQKFV